MSIDREFTFLNKTWNSLSSCENVKNLVNEWKNKPWKMADFIKNSTLKYLIPALIMSLWWMELYKQNKKKVDYNKFDKSEAPVVYMEENDIKFSITNSNVTTSKYLDTDEIHFDDMNWIVMDNGDYNKNHISSIPLDEELDYAPWMHILQTSKEGLYLAMNKKLSFEDYQDMFKWLKDLGQWTIWNCYFVVALKNLARSKYFDTLIMSSIERLEEDCFNIYMPLWEPCWMKITISPKDLEASTIKWPIWYKVLEIWFAKYLLFKKEIIPNTNVIMTEELMEKMGGWLSWEAMQTLLWLGNFSSEWVKNVTSNRSKILKSLRNFDPKNLTIISVSSKRTPWKTDQDYFKVWENMLYYGHGYLISCVEKVGNEIKYVTLDNPRNNEKREWWTKITLTLPEFFEAIYAVQIGSTTKKFLDFCTLPDEIKIADSFNRKES